MLLVLLLLMLLFRFFSIFMINSGVLKNWNLFSSAIECGRKQWIQKPAQSEFLLTVSSWKKIKFTRKVHHFLLQHTTPYHTYSHTNLLTSPYTIPNVNFLLLFFLLILIIFLVVWYMFHFTVRSFVVAIYVKNQIKRKKFIISWRFNLIDLLLLVYFMRAKKENWYFLCSSSCMF